MKLKASKQWIDGYIEKLEFLNNIYTYNCFYLFKNTIGFGLEHSLAKHCLESNYKCVVKSRGLGTFCVVLVNSIICETITKFPRMFI